MKSIGLKEWQTYMKSGNSVTHKAIFEYVGCEIQTIGACGKQYHFYYR